MTRRNKHDEKRRRDARVSASTSTKSSPKGQSVAAKARRRTEKKGSSRSGRPRPKLAAQADRHVLYQGSVQTPEADIEFFTTIFREIRRRKPLSIREDFCGTAYFAVEWAKSSRSRTAIGVDLDGPTLEWGRSHNLEPAGRSVMSRVRLMQANVLDVKTEQVDVVCAMNFSFWVFKDRATVLRYFRRVRAALVDDGIFFTEVYGGTEAIVELEDARECDGFDYVWEQEYFNPITHESVCHIHYDFPDGSRLRKAFSYDWRVWSIPEVRELLAEAGFSDVRVYWEDVDEDGDGNGEFHQSEEEENQESWLCYLVAIK